MKRLFLLLLFLSFAISIKPQTSNYRDQYFILNLSQIRESMNFGFVFSGPQLQYGRIWQWQTASNRFEIESQLGFSALSEKGMGFDFHISPINFNYLIGVNNRLWIGPCFISDYNYEFYPNIQVGHDFWFSHFSAGISLFFQKAFQTRLLSMKFSSSLFGFTSRTPENFDPLFFNVGFKYAIKDLNKTMQFRHIGQYRVCHFESSLKSLQAGRTNFSFIIDYVNYLKAPDWTELNYGIKITIHQNYKKKANEKI